MPKQKRTYIYFPSFIECMTVRALLNSLDIMVDNDQTPSSYIPMSIEGIFLKSLEMLERENFREQDFDGSLLTTLAEKHFFSFTSPSSASSKKKGSKSSLYLTLSSRPKE